MEQKTELLSKILRELESEIGTRDLSILILNALISAIQSFKADDAECFCKQFSQLVCVVSNTEPKFGVLNYDFAKLVKEFERSICKRDFSEKKWKSIAIARVKEILTYGREQKRILIKNSEEIDVEGKTILIHDHSHTVQDVLVHYKHLGRHFNVIIAEQDFDKTHGNIERMHKARIPFEVVPAYMLSHIYDSIDMAFFGAVTLKDSMNFVMSPGTHGVISEFHVDKIPVYMFISTRKFSLWESKTRGEIFIHKHKRDHHSKPIQYDRIKYSHDRVPLSMFKRVVTNQGVFTPSEVKKVFDTRMKKYGDIC